MTGEKKNEHDDKKKDRGYKLKIFIDKSSATKYLCDMYAIIACDSFMIIDCN